MTYTCIASNYVFTPFSIHGTGRHGHHLYMQKSFHFGSHACRSKDGFQRRNVFSGVYGVSLKTYWPGRKKL